MELLKGHIEITAAMVNWIISERKRLKLKQNDIERKAKLYRGAISAIEKQTRKQVSGTSWKKIQTVLVGAGATPFNSKTPIKVPQATLAARLKAFRSKMGISQTVFAKNFGVTMYMYKMAESGEDVSPSLAKAFTDYLDKLEALPQKMVRKGELTLLPKESSAHVRMAAKPASLIEPVREAGITEEELDERELAIISRMRTRLEGRNPVYGNGVRRIITSGEANYTARKRV